MRVKPNKLPTRRQSIIFLSLFAVGVAFTTSISAAARSDASVAKPKVASIGSQYGNPLGQPTTTFTPTDTPTNVATDTPIPTCTVVVPSLSIQDSGFAPSSLTVTGPVRVRWTNNGALAHTTTSDIGAWDSGRLEPGEDFITVLFQPGTYTYHCTIHSCMTGILIVNPSSCTLPTYTPTPTFTPTPSVTGTPPTLTRTRAPTSTCTPCAIPFTDIHPTDYFYRGVQYLYCKGAISGYQGNVFLPYNNTTRGQLTKIVVLGYSFPLYTPPTPTFRDVPTTNPFYQYIESAYHQGLISGYTCGTGCLEFRPNNLVTRAQVCKIVVLAAGWTLICQGLPIFRDVLPTDPFYGYIETAYNHMIIAGYSCGPDCIEFRPNNSATRGQICKIVRDAIHY